MQVPPAQVGAPPPANAAPAAAAPQFSFKTLVFGILRSIIIYYIFSTGMQYLTKKIMPTPPTPVGQDASASSLNETSSSTSNLDSLKSNVPISPFLPIGTEFAFQMYLSSNLESSLEESTENVLIWKQQYLYFDSSSSNERHSTYILQQDHPLFFKLVQNQTIFIHSLFTRKNSHTILFRSTKPFNRYRKMKINRRVNLLETKETVVNETITETNSTIPLEDPIGSFINPNITLHMIDFHDDFSSIRLVPPNIAPFLKIQNAEQTNPTNYKYAPFVYWNDFWILKENYIQIVPKNETLSNITLFLEYNTLNVWKWQLYLQMDMSMNMQKSMGLMTDQEAEESTEELKRMLIETNPYLLAVTIFVSILHSVFDFLAFKNDIAHWKGKKDMRGVSVKTIIINTGFQLIIFLYLVDNDTSWMILISNFIGLLIEGWKITKSVTIDWKQLTFENKSSYTKSKTKEYDDIAMKYLSYAAYPLVIGYSIYSLLYQTHKSWYSWILSSLVSFIYAFGFILMIPQLYINYRLKSVAHMSWKAFMYKSLNTVIDDLFSFVIKMPLLHRIACFRDDIVFIVYLYQRWKYPVDVNRVNEFGQFSGLTTEEIQVLQVFREHYEEDEDEANEMFGTYRKDKTIENEELKKKVEAVLQKKSQ